MANADALAQLPFCALACLGAAIGDSPCAPADSACVCGNEKLNEQATACVMLNCTVREQLTTKNATASYCGIEPFVDHSYIPVFIVFIILAGIAVLLRFLARIHRHTPLWWDDFLNLSALLGCIAYTILSLLMKYHGFGIDIWAVSFDDATAVLKAFYASSVLYITIRDLIRLSILLFYVRIFGHIPLARRLIIVSFVGVVTTWTAFAGAIIFQCSPVDYFWIGWDGQHEGHCINQNAMAWAGAAVVTTFDVWIMAVPLPFVAHLQLSARKKLLSSIMFVVGICVVAVSLVRLRTINQFTLTRNPTVDFVPVAVWSGLELYVGVVCACLPSIHTLMGPMLACFGAGRWAEGSAKGQSGGNSGSRSILGPHASARSWLAKPRSVFTHGQRLPGTPPDSSYTSPPGIERKREVEQLQEVALEPAAYSRREVWQLEDMESGDAGKQVNRVKTQVWT